MKMLLRNEFLVLKTFEVKGKGVRDVVLTLNGYFESEVSLQTNSNQLSQLSQLSLSGTLIEAGI